MTRSAPLAVVVTIAVAGLTVGRAAPAERTPILSGQWTLNKDMSSLARDVGFGADLVGGAVNSGPDVNGGNPGGRGRGEPPVSTSGLGAFLSRRESQDDAKRARLLTDEAKDPPAQLKITETATTVTIADNENHSRTFRTDGKEQIFMLDDVPVSVTSKWDSRRLLIVYQVAEDRELRYAYSVTPNPTRLTIDVQFVEKKGRDAVRRVYDPLAAATAAPPAPAAAPAPPPPTAARPPASAAQPAQPAFSQERDAELKGITNIGLLVEDVGSAGGACGLKQDALEAAASQSLSDAGFTVRRNSDEDTYMYVQVLTTSVTSANLCVSRYDVFVYTHTTAKLSYQQAPVLVLVSLLHKGGIAGGAPATHTDAVLKGVKQYADQFATRIRGANK